MSTADRAVLRALCREHYDGEPVPLPATIEEIVAELDEREMRLTPDEVRGALHRLCAAYGLERLGPDAARGQLFKLVVDRDAGVGRERPRRKRGAPLSERLPSVRHVLRSRTGRTVAAIAAMLALGAGAYLVLSPSDPTDGVPQAKVLDPNEMDGAQGVVRYCTGTDLAVDAQGTPGQHHRSRDDFNRSFAPGLRMKLIDLGDDADKQLETLTGFLRRGSSACDVVYADVIWIADLVRQGWLLNLTRYINERRHASDFVPTMLGAATIGRQRWGVPKQADAGLLFYRKDHVTRPPRTWQELYAQAAHPKGRLRYQGLGYEGLTVNFLELAYAAGADDILGPDGVNQAPAQMALSFMVDGIRHAAPYAVVDQKEAQNQKAFAKGRADFMRNWPGYEKALNANPRLAGRVASAALPIWEGGRRGSVLGGHILVIPKFSRNPGAALKVVDYLTSRSLLKRDAIDYSLAPALSDLWQDPETQRALPSHTALYSEILHARLRPRVPNYQAVSRAIYTNVNRALRGDAEPGPALEAANDQMRQAMQATPP